MSFILYKKARLLNGKYTSFGKNLENKNAINARKAKVPIGIVFCIK